MQQQNGCEDGTGVGAAAVCCGCPSDVALMEVALEEAKAALDEGQHCATAASAQRQHSVTNIFQEKFPSDASSREMES
jgi:hypothetical protein